MSSLLLDFLSAGRFFARRKTAFVVCVLTMGLALGANTAVFSVLKAFLYANLAVPEADGVHQIFSTRELPGRGTVEFYNAWPGYRLLHDGARAFEGIGVASPTDLGWDDNGEARRLNGARVSASVFSTLRVQPLLGRLFTEKDEGATPAPVALISHRLWRSAFNGATDAIGRNLRLNGTPHTVLGVMPENFSQPTDTDVWLPVEVTPQLVARGFGAKIFMLYARLADGVTPAAAQDELKRLAAQAADTDVANKDWSFRSRPLRDVLLDGGDRVILLVQAGAAVLLLLAISNLASLLLAWAAERQRETAVRLALGAPVARIVRQFLVQSLLLVAAGGAVGLALAAVAMPAWQRLNPSPDLDYFLRHLQLDGGTLGFTALLVLGTGLLAGLVPAWQARQTELVETLKQESRGGAASRASLRWQKAMVVVQAAIAVLVLSCAALLALSFRNLRSIPLGFEPQGRGVIRVQLGDASYAASAERGRFVQKLSDEFAKQPELADFGLTTCLPVGDTRQRGGYTIEQANGEFTVDAGSFHQRGVSPRYFATVGIPLRRGRDLTAADLADTAAGAALVSQAVADKYWPGQDALGRRLKRTVGKTVDIFTVVGVVGNVQDSGPAAPAGETIYLPITKMPHRKYSVVLRGAASAETAIAAGQRALKAAAPGMASFDPARLDALVDHANALPRLQMVLLGIFGAVAVGITALGSYGVMGQLVANRRNEMAIRCALGAEPGDVLRLTLRQNAQLALAGAALGIAGAWFAGRMLQSSLFGVNAQAPWIYLAVALGTLGVTQLASLGPALRSARVDVPTTLRSG